MVELNVNGTQSDPAQLLRIKKKAIAVVTVFFQASPSVAARVSAILSALVLRRRVLVRD